MKIKNYFSAPAFEKNYEFNDEPSQTIPDQTMSMRELLDRHARGLPTDVKVPVWDENPDIDDILPDPKTLDLSERQEFINSAKAEIAEIKKKANTKKKHADEPSAKAEGETA